MRSKSDDSHVLRHTEKQQQIRRAWEAFAAERPVDPEHVPPHILRAWNISKLHGISPMTPQLPPVLGKKEFTRLLHRHQDLMDSAEPVLRMLEVSIRNTGYIATLAVAAGHLLAVVGDDDLMAEAHRVFNIPGALRSIEAVGSSALSLSITERRPLQMSGYEHYNCMFHEWKCAAAPIFDAGDNAIASLTISGHILSKEHHTLALVKSCAEVITIRLRENALLHTQKRLNSMLQSVYNALPEAVVAIREDGIITHANSNAQLFLGLDDTPPEGKGLETIFRAEEIPRARALLLAGKPQTCEMEILCREGPQRRTCRLTPIRLSGGAAGGMTLAIATRSQLLDIVRHVGGNYAKYSFSDIKGKNSGLLVQVALAKRAAAGNSRVLLTGESGTGKELFAQSIHNSSAVRGGPFVAISCAAIPRDLIESELFGYVGGTFTGAREKGMIGKFELASGGTLFLDEINSLPLEMQAKLLRALQQREIMRIGDTKTTAVNARIIAATNVDLLEATRQGAFREDLYYRLNVVEINIPPLRERIDDIELLTNLILRRQSAETHLPFPQITQDALAALRAYAWPGNVRELDNVCERALLLSNGGEISAEHLPPHIARTVGAPERPPFAPGGTSVEESYRALIAGTLELCNGNISKAADRLGVARSTLYRNMRKFHLTPDASKDETAF